MYEERLGAAAPQARNPIRQEEDALRRLAYGRRRAVQYAFGFSPVAYDFGLAAGPAQIAKRLGVVRGSQEQRRASALLALRKGQRPVVVETWDARLGDSGLGATYSQNVSSWTSTLNQMSPGLRAAMLSWSAKNPKMGLDKKVTQAKNLLAQEKKANSTRAGVMFGQAKAAVTAASAATVKAKEAAARSASLGADMYELQSGDYGLGATYSENAAAWNRLVDAMPEAKRAGLLAWSAANPKLGLDKKVAQASILVAKELGIPSVNGLITGNYTELESAWRAILDKLPEEDRKYLLAWSAANPKLDLKEKVRKAAAQLGVALSRPPASASKIITAGIVKAGTKDASNAKAFINQGTAELVKKAAAEGKTVSPDLIRAMGQDPVNVALAKNLGLSEADLKKADKVAVAVTVAAGIVTAAGAIAAFAPAAGAGGAAATTVAAPAATTATTASTAATAGTSLLTKAVAGAGSAVAAVGAKIATAEKAVDDVKKDATKTAEDIATIVDPLEKDVAGLKKTADPIITEARKVIAEAKASPDPEVQKLAVEEEKKIDKMLASVGMGGTNPLIILVGVGLAIMSYMSATKGKK